MHQAMTCAHFISEVRQEISEGSQEVMGVYCIRLHGAFRIVRSGELFKAKREDRCDHEYVVSLCLTTLLQF